MSMAIVIGPTPPGNGRDIACHRLYCFKIHIPAELTGLIAVHSNVDHRRAGFTISAVTNLAFPTAATKISARRQIC